jgi:hypothetical protein
MSVTVNALDRDPKTGWFLPGNKAGKAWSMAGKVHELRAALYQCVTVEDVRKVIDGLIQLCLTDPDSRVRLAATHEFLNRVYGKATERVELDVYGEAKPAPLADLSPDEVAVLQKVVSRRGGGEVIEAEVVE